MTAAIDLSARLAEILADPDFEPELLARALADIGDTPRTLAESDARLEKRRRRKAEMGIVAKPKRRPLKMPPRADRFDCLAFGATCKYARLVDGSGMAHPMACRKCQPCQEWRVFKLMVRYRHFVRSCEEQTIVKAMGCPNVDAARRWASAQGERCSDPRTCLLVRSADYRWETIIVYAQPLSEHDQLAAAEAMAKQGIEGDVETRPVSPEEFQALVPREACAEGPEGVSRRTCLFTGWPDYETDPPDYLEDDGYTETGIMQTKSEPTPLPGWALVRSRLPLEERAALNASEWCDVAILEDYIGPSALETDARSWQPGKPWREAYRPMLRLLGAENKAPPAQCRRCPSTAPLTPGGLCIGCELSSG